MRTAARLDEDVEALLAQLRYLSDKIKRDAEDLEKVAEQIIVLRGKKDKNLKDSKNIKGEGQ